MTEKEKALIIQLVNKIFEELKELGVSALSRSFEDYEQHEASIRNLLVMLKYV